MATVRSIEKLIALNPDLFRPDKSGDGEQFSLTTGFDVLDDFTRTCKGGSLVVIGGRPGMGCSVFAMEVAYSMATRNWPVLVFPTEKSATHYAAYMTCMRSRIGHSVLARGSVSVNDMQRFADVQARMAGLPLFFADAIIPDLVEIVGIARDLMPDHRPRLIVIDSYHSIHGIDDACTQGGRTAVAHMLKLLAQCLDAIVIVTYGLPREVEERPNKRPTLDDLNGDPIKDASDLVLLLYRDEIYEEDSKCPGTANIIVARNRNGPIGGAMLRYAGHPPHFSAYDPGKDFSTG